jgi:putative metallohydrolase (TIGR04338 family)
MTNPIGEAPPMSADPQKLATYRAEDRLLRWLSSANPSVIVDVTTYRPEVDEKFIGPGDVQRYVDAALARLRDAGKDYGGQESRPVAVRPRRGNTKAVYSAGEIAIPPLQVGGSWALRSSVVLHELAHHLAGEGGHGSTFRATFIRLLEDLGKPVWAELLHLAFASEGLDAVEHHVGDDTIAKIAKLLRQAERASNEHERAAFLAKAQSLATQHSIALAVARAHTADEERREGPVEETVVIGEHGKRGLSRYVRLLLNIAGANDLKCLISHDSTRVFLYGFRDDIQVVRALYESVLVQMVTDCQTFLRDEGPSVVPTITRRLAFYEGYAIRIGQRLYDVRDRARAHAIDHSEPERSESTALALRAKEIAVSDHFAEIVRKQRIRGSYRGATSQNSPGARPALLAGHAAADRARLGGERALGA